MRMGPGMNDDEKGKLFVGGLSWETSQDSLQRYFGRYGEVIDCVVMKNNESGRSRGFGFVTFADPNSVSMVLQNGPHNLDGRTIDPKPCNPRTLQKPKRGAGFPKVFLGGLPSNITETDLRVFFGRYGKVMEVVIMYDQEKKKSRGFGFLSFEDESSVERVTSEHYINLNGKQVEIKKAEPRDGSNSHKVNNEGNQWAPHQGVPIGAMQGPNGQMSGPPMNVAAINAPNMMQGYQGWSTSQQQNYGYGNPSGPASYQSWGAPHAPQGPPPPQWGNYNTNQQNQGYGNYGPSGASGAANWNSWNMAQNSAGTGTGGDIYTRPPQTGAAPSAAGPAVTMPPTGQSTPVAKTTEYSGYGTAPPYGNYTGDQATTYLPRSQGTYNTENVSQPPPYQQPPPPPGQGKGF